jgi:penicillin-binding protein 1A
MRIFLAIMKSIAVLTVLAAISMTVGYLYFSRNLPHLTSLADYQPPLTTRIFNDRGELIAEYADEHRILTPFSEIPLMVRNAFLAAEDQQFYEHPGINPARILSAAIANLRAGHTVQGGSTITQQVAKNFLLSPQRTYTRKIREAILAYRIEQKFTKDEILYLYLNQIYLGRGAYGVASAAWRYFGKRLDQLTLGEAAMLAGLPKAPTSYAPNLHPRRALQRRNTVLSLMLTSGLASKADVDKALKEPLTVAPLYENTLTDSYENAVYQQLAGQFGASTLRRQGLTVLVPYDPQAEQAAQKAVRTGDLDLEQRQPYRFPTHHDQADWPTLLASWKADREAAQGPLGTDQTMPALVEAVLPNGDLKVDDGLKQWTLSKPDWRWEDYPDTRQAGQPPGQQAAPLPAKYNRPRTWIAGDEILLQGDGKGGVRLTQAPSIESALYSVDLQRGTVLARVGGYDYHFGDFDRVSQAERQPGSAFKPFIYATALDEGYTPASILMDSPIVFDNQELDEFWRPENYRNRFAGPVTLRNALEHSRNLASIKLLQNIGVSTFLRALKNYPMHEKFPAQLALALGATEVTLEDLTNSYIVLATGQRWKPVAVQQVQDRTGTTLYRSVAGHRCQVCHADPVLAVNDAMKPATPVLDPTTSFLITNLMHGVIQHGTGRGARALGRPAAGKTGTTDKQVDAWFMGFTPQVLTGVWSGRDTPTSMGHTETGAHAALPIWLQAMKAFEKGRPVENFTPPPGIEWVMIDPKTGQPADVSTKSPFLEAFRQGTAPTDANGNQPGTPSTDHPNGFYGLGL